MTSRRGRQPQRTCIACRRVADQGALTRYVLAPDGQVLVDYRHKLPGRGAYTCPTRDCMEKAVERRQFQRTFRGKDLPPTVEGLIASLESQIADRVEGLLGMARKSGQIESGSNAVLGSLRQRGKFALVVLTEDISENIGDKLASAAERQGVPVFKTLGKDRLGQLLGKGERSVAAVNVGALASALLVELQRLAQMAREN
ncbi:MAG TPA: DUF448 domain-containing protein [Geopsychrobacteraceae bacterium]|nr:DUF448 domain-containing protein [Geopsychrobacteraceae bacterium]